MVISLMAHCSRPFHQKDVPRVSLVQRFHSNSTCVLNGSIPFRRQGLTFSRVNFSCYSFSLSPASTLHVEGGREGGWETDTRDANTAGNLVCKVTLKEGREVGGGRERTPCEPCSVVCRGAAGQKCAWATSDIYRFLLECCKIANGRECVLGTYLSLSSEFRHVTATTTTLGARGLPLR